MLRQEIRPEAVEEVAIRALPRRPWIWPGRLGIVIAASVITVGVLGMIGKHELIPITIALAVLLGSAIVTFGVRKWMRGRSIDKTIEAINAVVRAAAPTRDLVRAKRWKEGWVGYPEEFEVKYPADLIDSDPKFQETLVAQISNRMGVLYRIRKNNARRCILYIARDRTEAEVVVEDAARIRLESIVQSIIPGMTVTSLEREEVAPEPDAEPPAEGGESDASTEAEKPAPATKISSIGFAWPASQTSRINKQYFQKQLNDAIRDAVGEPFVTQFDLTKDCGISAPPVPFDDIIPHPPRDDAEPMKIIFGQFRDGTKCIWDLDAPVPHVLIVGGTGGGKTVLLLSLLTALPNGLRLNAFGQWVRDENAIAAEIYPIDPKRLGLFNLDLIPGAKRAATREAAFVDYLLEVRRKMDERYEYLEENGPHLRATLDPIVLTVDEGEEMVELLNEWWRSGEGKEDWMERHGLTQKPTGTVHPAVSAFGSILRLGREARVHVILASQQASATWITTSMRGQFAVRIALQNLEASTSMMTFGSLVATRGLEAVPGRAWVQLGLGMVPDHAQIFWTPKLSPGLNDRDREILHNLGITLPDDPGFVDPRARIEPVREKPAPALVESSATDPEIETKPAGEDLELLLAAAELVISSEYGSTAMLQRKLRMGFAKATKIMSSLEVLGIVGPAEGSKARQVLVPADELDTALAQLRDETPSATAPAALDASTPVSVKVPTGSSGQRRRPTPAPIRFVPTEYGDDEQIFDRGGAGRRSVDMPVSELELGLSILVDVDGISRTAHIDGIDVDRANADYMCISYTTEDGEAREMTVPEAESVSVLIES